MRAILLAAMLTACAMVAQAQQDNRQNAQPAERQTQAEAERERREAERARRNDGRNDRQPGVRCARYHRRGRS